MFKICLNNLYSVYVFIVKKTFYIQANLKLSKFLIFYSNLMHIIHVFFLSNSGDSLRHSNNAYFNTKDKDNDNDKRNCAEINKTAGWFNAGCFNTNLNGEYRKDSQNNGRELTWYHWGNTWRSLKSAKIMIRPM